MCVNGRQTPREIPTEQTTSSPTFLCPICGISVVLAKDERRLAMYVPSGSLHDKEPAFQRHECIRFARSVRPDGAAPAWVLNRILTTLELLYPQSYTAQWIAQDDFREDFPRRIIWEALTELRMQGKIRAIRTDENDATATLWQFLVPLDELTRPPGAFDPQTRVIGILLPEADGLTVKEAIEAFERGRASNGEEID